MNKVELGRKGESAAVQLLKDSGYRILDRNVRARFGEIDLVAKEGNILCFVEIKARTGLQFGWPEEAVNFKKRWQLGRLANWYLQAHRLDSVPVRFDVVSILLDSDGKPTRTRLIKSAFDI